ncbi:MAG: hypothetical protein ABIH83_02080 [Candidatus Micrarchaeota archaeon]
MKKFSDIPKMEVVDRKVRKRIMRAVNLIRKEGFSVTVTYDEKENNVFIRRIIPENSEQSENSTQNKEKKHPIKDFFKNHFPKKENKSIPD